MSAFNSHDFANASVETDTYANRVSQKLFGVGPIPFTVRYITAASTAFLYVQFDRVVVTSGAMTTTTNYIITGTSAPTVTAVLFTTGKSFLRLTLSGTLGGGTYTLQLKDQTITDGVTFSIATSVIV